MSTKKCLNCEEKLTGNFCSNCGQKSATHRISFKNFISHDVMHGVFHIERGIFYTAKEALTRPGKAALDYISGKRKRYYNVFYLILICVGLIIFLRHFYEALIVALDSKYVEKRIELNEASKKLDAIFSQKSKIIVLLFVPFAALNSFILFRRKKLNLSEHAIIAGMILLGMLLLTALGNILFYFNLIIEFNDLVANTISISTVTLINLYIGYGYFNAFNSDYSKLGILYRIVLFFGFILFEIVLLLYLLIGYATNWEFGEVILTPFS